MIGADAKTVVPFLINFLTKTDSPYYRQRIPEFSALRAADRSAVPVLRKDSRRHR